ncbi:hypothetical protein JCM25156A_08640 [Komagataeibacter kakiaceti JCM 25156]
MTPLPKCGKRAKAWRPLPPSNPYEVWNFETAASGARKPLFSWLAPRKEGEGGFASGAEYPRGMVASMRTREIRDMAERLARETGQPIQSAEAGEYVTGTYRQRLTLASGHFAMIDGGLGFQLVPWTPSLEKQIGRHVSGVAREDGSVDWSFGRKRDMGIAL